MQGRSVGECEGLRGRDNARDCTGRCARDEMEQDGAGWTEHLLEDVGKAVMA